MTMTKAFRPFRAVHTPFDIHLHYSGRDDDLARWPREILAIFVRQPQDEIAIAALDPAVICQDVRVAQVAEAEVKR